MKRIVLVITACFISSVTVAKGVGHTGESHSHNSSAGSSSGGNHSISGYTKKNGTYVTPSRATNPDKSKKNNWTQKGNVNPNTGKKGTRDR